MSVVCSNKMTTKRLIKNVALTTIPTSIALFSAIYFLTKNINWAVSIPALLLGASVYSNIVKFKKDKSRQAAGISKQIFKSEKVYDLITEGDLGPALCFELENEKYLLINGQWIFSPDIYGDEMQKYYLEDSIYFNGYSSPYSFPARQFEIWTSEVDGKPIRINITGAYLEPEKIPCELPRKFADKYLALLNKEEINIGDCQQQCRGARD